MKANKFKFILFLLFLSCHLQASVVDVYLPNETLLFQLPNNETQNWKSINRCVTPEQGIVEYIPLNQTETDWIDLIAIHYVSLADIKIRKQSPVDQVLEAVEKATLAAYPGSEVVWKVIDNKRNEALYEWILPAGHGEIPPQHEIAYISYRNKKLHRVGVTHKNGKIKNEERNKWIKLLSESVSFVSQENLKCPSKELSLITQPGTLVDYQESFSDWTVFNNRMLKTNVHQFCLIPAGHDEANVSECLDITSMPRAGETKGSTIDQIFEGEKTLIKNKLGKESKIQILGKSATEIIFTYNYFHSEMNLIVTEIARVRFTPDFYLSIHYKKGLPAALSHEEVLMKKKQLETIHYKCK